MNKKEVKQIIKTSKKLVTYQEKLDFLHNKFNNEVCYILGCGPSLKDIDKNKLSKELTNNICLSIKLSYFSFTDLIDFHFFNCNNYKFYPYTEKTFFISQADFCSEKAAQASIWKSQQYDINVQVPRQEKSQTLTNTKDFKSWTYKETGLKRPWGPGIMYESVLFFAHHLGCKEIRTVGWDYKDPLDNSNIEHFYEEKDRISQLVNPAAQPYKEEIKESILLSQFWDSFFSENNKKLKCFDSKKCHLHKKITRYKL